MKYARQDTIAESFRLTASFVVVLNPSGQVLLTEAVGAPDGVHVRHTNNNIRGETYPETERRLSRVSYHVAQLIGDQNWVVGWKLSADLASIHLGFPRAHCCDLAREPVVRTALRLRYGGEALVPITALLNANSVIPIPLWLASDIFSNRTVDLRENGPE